MERLREVTLSAPVERLASPEETWGERANRCARELESLLDEATVTTPALERSAIRLAQALVRAVIDQVAVISRLRAP